MARYRKIDVRVWGDERFRRLSTSAQMLWFFLLTGPHTTSLPGLSRASEVALADEIGWTPKAFRDAFAEVFREGMAKADWKARVLWIPNVIKYDRPNAPNVIISWRVLLDEIPECRLKDEAVQSLKAFVNGMGEGFREAFRKVCPIPSRKVLAIPEPEPEPEPEQEEDGSHAEPGNGKLHHSAKIPENGTLLDIPPLPPRAHAPKPDEPLAPFQITLKDGTTWSPPWSALRPFILQGDGFDAEGEPIPGKLRSRLELIDLEASLTKLARRTAADPEQRPTAKGAPAKVVNWLTAEIKFRNRDAEKSAGGHR